ncbi:hypothetical protein NMG60_11000440 [Bertholletia excelsa]
MSSRWRSKSIAFHIFAFCSALLNWFPGTMSSAVVTLDSIQIFKTHEWIRKPTVYFQCKGENKTVLPDVKETYVSYNFKGEESWQPLTAFSTKKCKRCGIYEEDLLKSDVFDEWEFCPSDFTEPDGRYIHSKDNEFNATFLCSECLHYENDSEATSASHDGRKGTHLGLVITIIILVSVVFVLGLVAAYKYWQKRRREQEQARFLQLFEEGDDIEDEFGLGPLDGVV